MEFPAPADQWLDVADHSIVIIGAIGLAILPGWFQARRNHTAIKEVGKKADDDLTAIRAQVVNGHATDPEAPKLRDDLDEIKASMSRWEPVLGLVEELRAGMEALANQMRAFRSDLMAEEQHRSQQIKDVREELDHRTGGKRHDPR